MIDKICEHTFLRNMISKESNILDLGANEGGFSLKITEELGCRAYAIEPIPFLFNSIKTNGLIKKFPFAIAAKTGLTKIYLPNDRCATMHRKEGEATDSYIMAEALSFRDLLDKLGKENFDLVKIDIEGEEVPVLKELNTEDLRKANQWTVEFHDFLYPEMHLAVEDLKKKFERAGFFCIPFSITNNGDILFVKKRTLSFQNYLFFKHFLDIG